MHLSAFCQSAQTMKKVKHKFKYLWPKTPTVLSDLHPVVMTISKICKWFVYI